MDDFLQRAVLAGLAVAVVAGPLGCFVVWRRMAYFGDALAHSALLGVVAGLLLGISPILGVAGLCAAAAAVMARTRRDAAVGSDNLLGIMAHGALALGLVLLSTMETVRVDLMGWLFGDILAVGWSDVILVWLGCVGVLGVLGLNRSCLIAMAVDEDLAWVEGHKVLRGRVILLVLVALTVAAAMKVVGVMLVTALLVIPAAAARPLARTPEQMALGATVIGVLSVLSGLWASWHFDAPSGPSIVVAATVVFILSRIGLFRGV